MAKFVKHGNGPTEEVEEEKKGGLVLSIFTTKPNGDIIHVHTGGIAGETDLEMKASTMYEFHGNQYGRPFDAVATIKDLGKPRVEIMLGPGDPKWITLEDRATKVNGFETDLQKEYTENFTEKQKEDFSHLTYGQIRDDTMNAMGHPWSVWENAIVHLHNDILELPKYITIENPGTPVETSTIIDADIRLEINDHVFDKPTIEIRHCTDGRTLYYCYWLDVPVAWMTKA